MKIEDLDTFTLGYLECALWSSSDGSRDDGGDPLDQNYDLDDIDPACLKALARECRDFQETEATDLAQAGSDEQNGHDFWLTRNGHGAGFWDRGYGETGERLSRACRPYGSVDLYVHNGKIFASGYEK